jgi:hypothetical protein
MFLDIIHRLVFCLKSRPEMGTSSVDWTQQSRFYLRTEIESLKYKQDDILDKDETMDNTP